MNYLQGEDFSQKASGKPKRMFRKLGPQAAVGDPMRPKKAPKGDKAKVPKFKIPQKK